MGTRDGKAREFLEIRVQATEFWSRINLGIAVNPTKVPRGTRSIPASAGSRVHGC